MGVFIFLIFIAGLVAGLIYAYSRAAKRREALFLWATAHGFEYSRQDQFDLLYLGFHLFSMGDGRGVENVLWGSWMGLPVKAADYWYYDESSDGKGGRSRTYHRFSVVIAELECFLPAVTVSKENLLTKLADHVGFQDINFESEQFNRQFQIKSRDREFAFKLIDARMIQWFLSTGGGFNFETSAQNVLVYERKQKSPEELIPLFGTAKEFHDRIPRIVWSEYGTPKQPGNERSAQ
ncbi:MAG: hypothetical protein ABR579_07490 [Actinomycetota bacterium]